MNLYQIDAQIMDCIDEDGEVVDIYRLNELEMARDKKISNIACLIKNLRADEDALAKEKKAIGDRQSAKHNEAERLEEYLAGYLQGATYEDARCRVSYRKSTGAVFEGDINKLPDEYCTIKRTENKTALKEALKKGIEIQGARLEERQNIQIK